MQERHQVAASWSKEILKEGAETTAMTHQSQEEAGGVHFDFYSHRIAAI